MGLTRLSVAEGGAVRHRRELPLPQGTLSAYVCRQSDPNLFITATW